MVEALSLRATSRSKRRKIPKGSDVSKFKPWRFNRTIVDCLSFRSVQNKWAVKTYHIAPEAPQKSHDGTRSLNRQYLASSGSDWGNDA